MSNITKKRTTFQVFPLRPVAFATVAALALLLSACGGGGGGSTSTASNTGTNSGSSSTSTSTAATGIPAGTTQVTPTYAPGSVQAAMFAQVNAYRTTCGFPAVQQNTLLDQAAQSHAQYMVLNGGIVTDSETQGKPGFTGATGQDSADALGWPSNVFTGRMDGGTGSQSTPSAMGTAMINTWAVGVYHQNGFLWESLMGLGVANESGASLDSLQIGGDFISIPQGNEPLTFPCQGVSGLPYGQVAGGELPAPPNGSASGTGTPVTVVGNLGDQVVLSQASMINTTTGQAVSVVILNSTTDPNQELGAYEAVAYPTSPLSPNTTYQVNLSGTINGNAFSRSFTFTTGSTLA